VRRNWLGFVSFLFFLFFDLFFFRVYLVGFFAMVRVGAIPPDLDAGDASTASWYRDISLALIPNSKRRFMGSD
jgi:hypothetical protein